MPVLIEALEYNKKHDKSLHRLDRDSIALQSCQAHILRAGVLDGDWFLVLENSLSVARQLLLQGGCNFNR